MKKAAVYKHLLPRVAPKRKTRTDTKSSQFKSTTTKTRSSKEQSESVWLFKVHNSSQQFCTVHEVRKEESSVAKAKSTTSNKHKETVRKEPPLPNITTVQHSTPHQCQLEEEDTPPQCWQSRQLRRPSEPQCH